MISTSVTEQICHFVENFSLSQASPHAREQAAIHIADTVGVAIAGASHPASRIVRGLIPLDPYGATLWPQTGTYAPSEAAWLNGVAAHALDWDDTSILSGAHLSAAVVPAVLALAENRESSGSSALEAYIVGHEVGERVGQTLPNMESYLRGWHGTATQGIIASVAGSARVLGLRGDKLRNALGIAASMAGGLRRNTGTMVTALHSGNAARNGVIAALLAEQGFTANREIFDGSLSYWDAFRWQGSPGLPVRLHPLGSPLGFEDPGVGISPYPCGSILSPLAEGVLAWKQELNFDAKDVESIGCALHPNAYRIVSSSAPKDAMEAKYSVPYIAAAICVFGKLTLNEFDESTIANPAVASIMPLVDVSELEEYEWTTNIRHLCEPPTHLELTLKGGLHFTKFLDKVKGFPGGGMFSRNDIREKFDQCTHPVMGPGPADALFESILNIATLESCKALFPPH